MANKILSLFLLATFLLTTGGIAINIHSCKMKGDTVSLNLNKKSCCEKKATGNCCKNLVKVFKIKDNFSATGSVNIKTQLSVLHISELQIFSRNFSPLLFSVPNFHSPPIEPPVPLCILHHAFLI